jgi:alkanesulfonate monooxygenase SsuD/methylene tetrahydromethanopterin reductase-like flavin-dependent oxidoreductase (luciferase family)
VWVTLGGREGCRGGLARGGAGSTIPRVRGAGRPADAAGGVTSYDGQFYRCEAAETVPLPVHRPRPPVTIAAHGPKMLGIAAEHGDGWSSWGGYGVETEEDFYVVTAERTHRFDDLCVAAGRDPAMAVVP